MNFRESEVVELKEIVTDDIKKEVIAFANSDGGKLYIGVADNGEVIGLSNTEEISLQISNMIRDAIKPDLTMFVKYETLEIEGKYVLEIEIQRGTDRPYYIAKKGLRPEGVFVRQGYSSVPATNAAIRKMIKETDGDRFEEMRSVEQELTFNATEQEFALRGIEFGKSQEKTLGIINSDGIYTNLGLLMSDQCNYTIKTAIFQGNDQMVFKDRQEFSGSLLKQMNDVYRYLELYNKTRGEINGLVRVDTRDYPPVALREALLNMLVHRDYSFSASAMIKIFDNRVEFISIGGLATGAELSDIMTGASFCRNQNLANVFFRLELIEAYGTGIQKMMQSYEKYGMKPKIEITSNTFKVTLPNVNAFEDEIKQPQNVSEEEALVLSYLKEHYRITRADVEKIFDVSPSTASRLLRRMSEENLLQQQGKGRSVRYILPREK